jgi:hypothetical protein
MWKKHGKSFGSSLGIRVSMDASLVDYPSLNMLTQQ